MPLTKTRGSNEIGCYCGKFKGTIEGYYAHVGECEILRCRYCLAALNGPVLNEYWDDESDHICPQAELTRIKRNIEGSYER